MNNRKLIILGIIAAVMVCAAVLQSRFASTVKQESDVATYLVQGLDPSIIDTISISGSSGEVELSKEAGKFVVVSKSGYPAKVSEINRAIQGVLDIQVGELVTKNPDNHGDLGVSEEAAKTIVKMTDEAGDVICGVVVGESKGAGVYVRLIDEDKVYAAERNPWISADAKSYIETRLTSVDRDKVSSVEVSGPAGSYVISAGEGQSAKLAGVPEGKKQKDSECKNVLFALGSVNLADVMKESEATDLSFDHKFVCKLTDSTVYTLEIAVKDEKYYAKCSAEFTDTAPVVKANKVESEDELKEKEQKLLAKGSAVKFAEATKGWIYELQSYQAKNMTKALADLVEDLPEPKPQPEEVEVEGEEKAGGN